MGGGGERAEREEGEKRETERERRVGRERDAWRERDKGSGGSCKSFAGRLVFLPFPWCQRKLEIAGNVREYLQVRSNAKFAEVVKSHAC